MLGVSKSLQTEGSGGNGNEWRTKKGLFKKFIPFMFIDL